MSPGAAYSAVGRASSAKAARIFFIGFSLRGG
jgi:hypothetical protein